MNGPIGIALGFTELSGDLIQASGEKGLDAETAARVREYLGLIESSTKRARSLSRNIWSFARSEPGTVEATSLSGLLENAAQLAGPAAKVSQLEIIRRDGDRTDVTVNADPALCAHALVELMLASIDALPEGGTVYWELDPESAGAHGGFILTAEPWGEARSREWPVGGFVRDAFASQDGQIGPAFSQDLDGPHPAWAIKGTLPAAAGIE